WTSLGVTADHVVLALHHIAIVAWAPIRAPILFLVAITNALILDTTDDVVWLKLCGSNPLFPAFYRHVLERAAGFKRLLGAGTTLSSIGRQDYPWNTRAT